MFCRVVNALLASSNETEISLVNWVGSPKLAQGDMRVKLAPIHRTAARQYGDGERRVAPAGTLNGFAWFKVNLIGILTCRNFVPGLQRHARNALIALASSTPTPVDFTIATLTTRPVVGSMVIRYTPAP
jgi:hypothetical protein